MSLSNSIIKEIQKGNKPFKLIYDTYYKQVFRFVYQKIESVDLVKDIVSETFIKSYKKLNTYKDQGKNFESWLYRIAYHEVMGYYRKSKQKYFIGIDELATQTISSELNMEQSLIDVNLVEKLFDGLSVKDAKLINLRFVEGRPFQEIAEILEMKEGAVKMKVYRLVKELKIKFKGVYP